MLSHPAHSTFTDTTIGAAGRYGLVTVHRIELFIRRRR